MTAALDDDTLDRQLAERLVRRGWSVTPPGQDKALLPEPPKIVAGPKIDVVGLYLNIPFAAINAIGGFDPNEAELSGFARGEHRARFCNPDGNNLHRAFWDKYAVWRGWHKNNVAECYTALTAIPVVRDFDPARHTPTDIHVHSRTIDDPDALRPARHQLKVLRHADAMSLRPWANKLDGA